MLVLINELAQWAVLLFLTIFVLGLTRQLGNFLVPPEQQRAREVGPGLGTALPADLLAAGARERLAAVMAARATGWAVFSWSPRAAPGVSG
jgi:hypothetical protein